MDDQVYPERLRPREGTRVSHVFGSEVRLLVRSPPPSLSRLAGEKYTGLPRFPLSRIAVIFACRAGGVLYKNRPIANVSELEIPVAIRGIKG